MVVECDLYFYYSQTVRAGFHHERQANVQFFAGSLSLVFPLWLLLCSLIALFYCCRLVLGRRRISNYDAENEIGHGLMAVGMALMVLPILSSDVLHWNIVLFAMMALWFTVRLVVRRPLLAKLLGKTVRLSSTQAEAIHACSHAGMCYMFLLLSSMALSMTRMAVGLNYLFTLFFLFLLWQYGREVFKDLQKVRLDSWKLGANLAHVVMSGMMVWMFGAMIEMSLRMVAT